MAMYLAPKDLPIADIEVGPRIRPVTEAGITALMHVIEAHGFSTPILVRVTKKGYRLIDGAHRLETMRRRGATDIPVIPCKCTDQEARALETGQNLAGAALSPLDEAIFLAEYATAYQELHPETKRGAAGGLARQGSATELNSFAETIAEKRGISPRQVRKIAAAGKQISPEEVALLRSAPRQPTLKDIEDLGKITNPEERTAVIGALATGTAKKVSDARRQFADAKGTLKSNVKSPVEEELQGLLKAWQRASAAARRRFVFEQFEEIERLVSVEAKACRGFGQEAAE